MQWVHVGEHVGFSFALTKGLLRRRAIDPHGIVDYCVAFAGPERIEADLDGTGHYRFAFDAVDLDPGDAVKVTAAAFHTAGVRDMKRIGDRWIEADVPRDPSDRPLAHDSVVLRIYKTVVELPIDPPGPDLDLRAGRLEIVRDDGGVSTVYSGGAGSGGFAVTGPEADGRYVVLHEPRADQVNKSGQTLVRFIALDGNGQAHTFEGYLPTP